MGWGKSYKEEIRERERRYREKIRRKLETYARMIDKPKVKEQIRADVMNVLKEAMNQEIPDHKLAGKIKAAVRKYFDELEKRWIFDKVFTYYSYDEKFDRAIKELDEGRASVVRGTFRDTVEVEGKITLEIPADNAMFTASTLMDDAVYELVELAEVVLEYTADIRKQGDKYLVKVLHVYDVNAIVY